MTGRGEAKIGKVTEKYTKRYGREVEQERQAEKSPAVRNGFPTPPGEHSQTDGSPGGNTRDPWHGARHAYLRAYDPQNDRGLLVGMCVQVCSETGTACYLFWRGYSTWGEPKLQLRGTQTNQLNVYYHGTW